MTTKSFPVVRLVSDIGRIMPARFGLVRSNNDGLCQVDAYAGSFPAGQYRESELEVVLWRDEDLD